jgi:hypothetical protein
MPRISVSAELADNGDACIMTLKGNKDDIAALKLPIAASVQIETMQ